MKKIIAAVLVIILLKVLILTWNHYLSNDLHFLFYISPLVLFIQLIYNCVITLLKDSINSDKSLKRRFRENTITDHDAPLIEKMFKSSNVFISNAKETLYNYINNRGK